MATRQAQRALLKWRYQLGGIVPIFIAAVNPFHPLVVVLALVLVVVVMVKATPFRIPPLKSLLDVLLRLRRCRRPKMGKECGISALFPMLWAAFTAIPAALVAAAAAVDGNVLRMTLIKALLPMMLLLLPLLLLLLLLTIIDVLLVVLLLIVILVLRLHVPMMQSLLALTLILPMDS
jgi:hypothetical protein